MPEEEENHVRIALVEERLIRGLERLEAIERKMDEARARQIQLMAGIAVSILLLLVNVIVEKL